MNEPSAEVVICAFNEIDGIKPAVVVLGEILTVMLVVAPVVDVVPEIVDVVAPVVVSVIVPSSDVRLVEEDCEVSGFNVIDVVKRSVVDAVVVVDVV